MPFGQKPQCLKCNTDVSQIWHKVLEGKVSCSECFIVKTQPSLQLPPKTTKPVEKPTTVAKNNILNESLNESVDNEDPGVESEAAEELKQASGTRGSNTGRTGKSFRKSGRGKNKKTACSSKVAVNKGRGRRAYFKKQPMKAPSSTPSIITTGCLFHQGSYFQVGDIVSLIDEDGSVYYAQIRGLLQDQYCEKSAVLTWLIPTQSSPPPEEGFDPLTYILGPEEDLPRKLEYMEFVMHAPNEYYKLDQNIKLGADREPGFIWTSIGPIRRTISV